MDFRDKTNSELMSYLAGRIRSERVRLMLTQVEFASQSGIPLRTYKRFEQDCNGSLENFINVLRASGRLGILEAIFVEVSKNSRTLSLTERVEAARIKSLSRD